MGCVPDLLREGSVPGVVSGFQGFKTSGRVGVRRKPSQREAVDARGLAEVDSDFESSWQWVY